MFLHVLASDSYNKFFWQIRELCEEALPGCHCYVQWAKKSIKNDGNTDYPVISKPEQFQYLLRSRNDWEGIIFSPFNQVLMKEVSDSIPICCVSWGKWAGIQSTLLARRYYPVTKKIVKKLSFHEYIRNTELYRMYIKYYKFPFVFRRLFVKLSVLAGTFSEEFDFLKENKILQPGCAFMPCFVGCQDPGDFVPGTGKDIFVGHYAGPSDNHLDIFERLRHFDLSGRKIIVPLSYPSYNIKYRRFIINKGYEIFGEHFCPLLDFLQRSDYISLLDGCSVMIQGRFDNSALGNISLALHHGKKVYLPRNSFLYNALKSRKINVLSIEDDLCGSDSDPVDPFTYEESLACSESYYAFRNREKAIRNMKELFSLLRSVSVR